MSENVHRPSYSLCWDCAKATGYCNWSAYLRPVKGWVAKEVWKEQTGQGYLVINCPEFVRDAIGHGVKRYPEEGEKDD
jgi:hypothetical protein